MSNTTVKKKRKKTTKRKKYLTSDLSSGINKRLSPNLQKRQKSQVKFTVCNFVCFTESFDCFWLFSSYKQFILGHSTKLFVVIQKESTIITTAPALICLPFLKDFPKYRENKDEL